MIISGLSSGSSIAFTPAGSRAQTPPVSVPGDQVKMSLAAYAFSNMVQEAGQMPEVRGELVESYKSRIQSGTYPSAATIDGLVDKMGSSWLNAAQSSGDDGSSSGF